MDKRTGKPIKFLVIMLFAMGVITILTKCATTKKMPQEEARHLQEVTTDTASGDTVTETLKTLTASLRKTQQQNEQVIKDNKELKSQVNTYQSSLSVLRDRLSLASDKRDKETVSEEKSHSGKPDSNWDSLKENAGPAPAVPEQQDLLESGGATITIINDLSGYHHDTQVDDSVEDNQLGAKSEKIDKAPYYTIPPNATAINTALLTTLIGRVPIDGKLDDPYPFKLIIGQDNLTANGLYLPEISGMVASGYAVGEMNNVGTQGNKCVRGYVTSVTFIFQDGTISTQSSNNNNKASDSDDNNALGWISDQYGNPCIDGKFYTNAPRYLAVGMGLNAASGAANAYSNSETTTLASGDSLISGVTGNQGRYVLGQAMSNSTKDADDWLKKRLDQSFDAVVVRPITKDGKYRQVAINFQHEIKIDYNPEGRKIRYAQDSATYRRHHLD